MAAIFWQPKRAMASASEALRSSLSFLGTTGCRFRQIARGGTAGRVKSVDLPYLSAAPLHDWLDGLGECRLDVALTPPGPAQPGVRLRGREHALFHPLSTGQPSSIASRPPSAIITSLRVSLPLALFCPTRFLCRGEATWLLALVA